jgi:hypothetical protein
LRPTNLRGNLARETERRRKTVALFFTESRIFV